MKRIRLPIAILFVLSVLATAWGETEKKGSKHPFAYRGANGDYLVGSRSCGHHVPAEVPAANFGSVTLYDASHASGLANGQPYPSIGSLDGLTKNDVGLVDLSFAPELPEGSSRVELAADGAWKGGVRLLPPRRADEALLRRQLETGRLHEDRVGGTEPGS